MKNLFRFSILTALLLIALPVFANGPIISGASNVTAEATSSAGASVTFNVTAADANGAPLTATCTPASGTTFAIGTTTVSCSATDSSNVTATAPFTVTVHDTAAPAITPPADQTFTANAFPASPTLVPATATDLVDPNPVLTHTPTSFLLGTTTVTWKATDASGNASTATSQVTITTNLDTATIQIFNNTTLVKSSLVALPDAGAPDATLTDDKGNAHTAPARSAIAVLEALDAQTTDFDVTDLQYFDGLGFDVNCVKLPSVQNNPLCTLFPPSWLYAVNGIAPTIGMSSELLEKGDVMQLYYSSANARQVKLNASSVASGQPVVATLQEYDPASGTYHAVTGFTIGVGHANPDFTFTEITTSPADSSGQATFTLNTIGSYDVGIKEDFYFPTTPLTITQASAQQQGSSGGGAGNGEILHTQMNVPSALSYLASKQNGDGSFNSALLTDWAAIAFASQSASTAQTNLRKYLLSATPSLSSATDYERHTMALEALGINPSTGTATNYIAPIIQTFDGTQIGDPSLDNDDIFALFPLLHTGYGTNDPIIQKETAFILLRQKPDGSWDESPDLTAAAIQALLPLSALHGTSDSLGRAAAYLASTQQSNGGWGNVDSTSWAQTAINAIKENPNIIPANAWTSSAGYLPTDALAQAQQPDGAVQPASDPVDMRVWSTSYAVVAASGKSWVSILQSFPQPPAAPATPTNLNVNNSGTGTTAALSWTASPTATSYNVYRSTDGGASFPLLASGITGTSYTATSLSVGAAYQFKVSAVASGEESSATSAAAVTISIVPSGSGDTTTTTSTTATTPIAAAAAPSTTTGTVAATAAAGGTTTVSTTAGTTAGVTIPASALSADATVSVAPLATTSTAAAVTTAVAAVPTGTSVVGGNVYSYTAQTATATSITTFSTNVTLNFTYTDAQVTGLDTSSLKVEYFNTTTNAWVALATTVNTATHTLTAVVNHFTYFAILGTPTTTTATPTATAPTTTTTTATATLTPTPTVQKSALIAIPAKTPAIPTTPHSKAKTDPPSKQKMLAIKESSAPPQVPAAPVNQAAAIANPPIIHMLLTYLWNLIITFFRKLFP